jgi:hypothetical protein
MTLFQRIKYYIIGVMLGSVLVYFMLIRNRDRNLSAWLPEKRVVQQIQDNPLLLTDLSACKAECLGLDEYKILEMLKESSVKFGRSEVNADPCPIYLLEYFKNEKLTTLTVETCKQESIVRDIISEEKECNC